VAASFVLESSLITILGTLSGTILGLLLAWNLVTSEYFFGSGEGVSLVVPWAEISVFILIAVGASLLMAWIPARRAARVPIAEALRYE
jgi:putative ABC transport system permease protein